MRWIPKTQLKQSLFVLILLACGGCPEGPQTPRYRGAGAKSPRYGGSALFHLSSDLRSLDPHKAYDELSFRGIRLLFDGLLDYDAEGNLVPSLAAALPQQLDGGRRFVLRLRSGLRFHNSRPLNADDVRWSLERMLHPDTGSPGVSFYHNLRGLEAFRQGKQKHISGIEVLGTESLAFQLDKADQTFLNALAMTFAYPVAKESYSDSSPTHELDFKPIGAGPYVFTSWERGVRLVFTRNLHYWRPGKPYVNRMVLLENVNRDIAMMRFRNGDLDHAYGFSPADYIFFKKAKAWQPYQVELPQPVVWGLTMNCELPPFDNVHMRRAVAFAIDRQRWSLARNRRLRVTGQPLPPSIRGYRRDLPQRQVFDLQRARAELKLAGHPQGWPEPISLWVGAGGSAQFFGELAQSDLARIGLKISIKQVAFAVFIQETGKPKTAQMTLSGWGQDFPDAASFLDILFHSRSIHPQDSENRSFYRNAQLDRLLDAARIEADAAKRKAMYEQASSMIAHDAPWAFIWNNLDLEAWQPYLRNYRPHPVWQQDYRFVWLDRPKRGFR